MWKEKEKVFSQLLQRYVFFLSSSYFSALLTNGFYSHNKTLTIRLGKTQTHHNQQCIVLSWNQTVCEQNKEMQKFT